MKRRAAAAAATAALVLAAPTAAHGPTATQAGYVSSVNAVLPNVLGLSANVIGGDVWLRVSNYSGKEIVILGYQGEPYLRFRKDEVFQNDRSPMAYVNRFRGLNARSLRDVAIRDQITRSSSDLPAEIRKVLEGIPVGQLSAPEVTRLGVELYAVCARHDSKADTPGKKQAREAVYAERFEQQSKQYIQRLRREALIERR